MLLDVVVGEVPGAFRRLSQEVQKTRLFFLLVVSKQFGNTNRSKDIKSYRYEKDFSMQVNGWYLAFKEDKGFLRSLDSCH